MTDPLTKPDAMQAVRSQPRSDSGFRRRFVILQHDHPFVHWDFLIEDGDSLASWRLLQSPQSGIRADAETMPPHRRHYLTWEGPVSGNRGTVARLFDGWLERTDAWPEVGAWAGSWLRMSGKVPAEHCRLIQGSGEQLHWEFA